MFLQHVYHLQLSAPEGETSTDAAEIGLLLHILHAQQLPQCSLLVTVIIAAGDSGHGNSNSGLNLPEQHMHQGLLCNNLGLPGMQQQPVHSQLPYQHANLDSGLANNMAHFGLGQNPLMDNLQGTHWQVKIIIHTSSPC